MFGNQGLVPFLNKGNVGFGHWPICKVKRQPDLVGDPPTRINQRNTEAV